MKSASLLMKNTLLLAGCNIVLRLCALCFQAYLASSIGPAELGMFGIIASVGTVFATISISGVRFSVTRLAAEETSYGNEYPLTLMKCAFGYALFFGIASWAGMYFSAQVLSVHYIGDLQVTHALRIISFSMPAIAIGGCIEGYFTAKQKISRLVWVQILSQLLRILFVVVMFALFPKKATPPTDILATGNLIGECAFCGILILMYLGEIFRKKERHPQKKHLRRMVETAIPLAVSAYMRTGLSSLGQVLIPAGLKKTGMGSTAAFHSYGIVAQMALPVVMFPAAFLGAMGEVLVPRLTDAQVQGKKTGISYIANRALRIGAMFSLGIMGIMLFFAEGLGQSVYKSAEAGRYIRMFAPIVPVIYIDSVTDGCLKGLGQQVYSMVYNVIEGVINVVLLFVLLPVMGVTGFVAVMYIKEIFNAVLSLCRLSKVTQLDFNVVGFIIICVCAGVAGLMINIVGCSGVVSGIAVYCSFYIALLYVLDAVSRDDIRWAVSLFEWRKI